jgi:hypothetical protein
MGSGNISSIDDNATGDYSVNLITAIEDENYSVIGTCKAKDSDTSHAQTFPLFTLHSDDNQTTSKFRCVIRAARSGYGDYDYPIVNAIVFR